MKRKEYVKPVCTWVTWETDDVCASVPDGPGATDVYSGYGDDYWEGHQNDVRESNSVWD